MTRICRAIRQESNDGVPQVIYYQAGVGTEESWWDHIYGGGTGAGLSENIREAYSFLAMNYLPGDQIFLLGFSRGAFTARSIGAMISCVGLLTPKGMADFYEVFDDWENQGKTGFKTRFLDRPFPNRPHVTDPTYGAELERVSSSHNVTKCPSDDGSWVYRGRKFRSEPLLSGTQSVLFLV